MYYSKNKPFQFYYSFLFLAFLGVSFSCTQQIEKVEEAEKLFGFELIVNEDFRSSSRNVSFRKVDDSQAISTYINTLIQEYKKYPSSYFQKIGLRKVIVCDSLFINTQRRAAYPDPYKKALFLSIDAFEKRKPYMIHVMHHELHHYTEFFLYGSMFYKLEDWSNFNEPDFTYGKGGATAYEQKDKKINWYKLTHPKEGFINKYAMLGQEEDRSELVALLMNKPRRDSLLFFCKTDARLRQKVRFLIGELNKMMGSTSNYWETILDELPEE